MNTKAVTEKVGDKPISKTMNTNENLEVLFLNPNSMTLPKPIKVSNEAKRTIVNEKRIVKFNNLENFDSLLITQEVKLKPNLKCIINVDTKITKKCSHKTKSKSKGRSEKKKSKHADKNFDRIVPCCFRTKCFSRVLSTPVPKSLKNNKCKSKKKNHKKHKKHKASTKVCDDYLSPVSSCSLNSKGTVSYESISTEDNISDLDDVETLIERTKRREEKQTDLFNNASSSFQFKPIKLPYENPIYPDEHPSQIFEDISDDNTLYSTEMDVSIHSLSTVVLNRNIQGDLYSPTLSPREVFAPCIVGQNVSQNSMNHSQENDCNYYVKRELDCLSNSSVASSGSFHYSACNSFCESTSWFNKCQEIYDTNSNIMSNEEIKPYTLKQEICNPDYEAGKNSSICEKSNCIIKTECSFLFDSIKSEI